MLLIHTRHATLALRRVAVPAQNHPQVRRIHLFGHVLGGPGYQKKPKGFVEWQQLPAEATTGAPLLWLHNESVTIEQKKSPVFSGSGNAVLGDSAMNITEPGVGLIRHDVDKTLDTDTPTDGAENTKSHANIPYLYRTMVQDPRGKKYKKSQVLKHPTKPSHPVPIPKLIFATNKTIRGEKWIAILSDAYNLILRGNIVEMHYRAVDKLHECNLDAVVAGVRANPHVWPAVVLGAMPTGTGFIMLPWTNGNEVVWIMGPLRKHTHGRARMRLKELRQGRSADERPAPRPASPGTMIPNGVDEFMCDSKMPLTVAMDQVVHGLVEKEKQRDKENMPRHLYALRKPQALRENLAALVDAGPES